MRAVSASVPIHVIIPTAGRPELIDRTLASLAACRKPAGYQGAVVVENGHPCGAEAIVAACDSRSGIRYLHVSEGNKSAALNAALATLESGLVVFFDDDVRLHPDVLVAYAEAAAEWRERAYFGGLCGVDYEERPPAWLLPYLPVSARGFDPRRKNGAFYLGFNWAAYVEEVREAGGFDPRFGPGSPTGATTGDETVMQQRLLKRGARPVHVVRAVVWHHVPRDRCTPEWLFQRARREGRSHAQMDAADRPFGGSVRACLSIASNVVRLVGATLQRDKRKRVQARAAIAFRAGFLSGLLHGRG